MHGRSQVIVYRSGQLVNGLPCFCRPSPDLPADKLLQYEPKRVLIEIYWTSIGIGAVFYSNSNRVLLRFLFVILLTNILTNRIVFAMHFYYIDYCIDKYILKYISNLLTYLLGDGIVLPMAARQ